MKNLFKKSLLSTSILSIALLATGVATAGNYKAGEQLSAAETKEVLHELTEDMAAEGIKVSFANTPKMSYDATLSADIAELERAAEGIDSNSLSNESAELEALAPLSKQAQGEVLATVLKDLADSGVTVNFGSQTPTIAHLNATDFDTKAEAAQYRATLKNIATDMLNSGSAANAAKVYEQANHGSDAQYAMDAIQDELASMGYKATFTGTPTVSIDQSAWQQDVTKPLTANDKRDLVADMEAQLADTGIIADLSKAKPSIERLPLPEVAADFDEKEFAALDAQFDAELTQMAQQVMNSGSLDKAADIIEAFENAGHDADLAM